MVVTDNIIEKMLPKIIKKHDDWYQDGFLFVKLEHDIITISTIDENNKNKFIIENDVEVFYDYISYLKKYTHTQKVNNYSVKAKNYLICEKCKDGK
jgi:hypothetical protein